MTTTAVPEFQHRTVLLDEAVHLDEGVRVKEKLDPFPRRQLPLRVLGLDLPTAPSFSCRTTFTTPSA